ncbi:hypothetical protein [Parachitinimonas caeni]|uniref:Uncharacterized protein n=1 Tax=Parachitinimonas caeni TaxID=3031301 RepID=A0ABT7E1P4_9NEIS|nr:hypothetical protein [Parachitinimonas caeni]MDK2126221.1 hypothetical protein [Parachitinimonas caeni]
MKNLPILFAMTIVLGSVNAAEPYRNPVDGAVYVADWKTYIPANGVDNKKGRVVNSGIRLLNSQADFEANTTPKELAKLIGYIHEVLAQHAVQHKATGEILVQIELTKSGKPNFKMSFQGNVQRALLEKFYKSLGSIEFNTRQSTVSLQAHFVLKDA